MLINADFSRRVVVAPHDYQWVPSPQAGVERVMLDRIGAERARATSIVRYAPQSHFPSHAHPGGEEILVLSGVFSEPNTHYPAGWYLRNPPGSSHQPSSEPGATLFVKLCQMSADNRASVRVNTMDVRRWTQAGDRAICRLYADAWETVWLERLPPGGVATIAGAGEMLLLEGTADIDGRRQVRGTWLRWPEDESTTLVATDEGACVYVKTVSLSAGQLPGMPPC